MNRPAESLITHTVQFCRELRERSIAVTPAEAVTAVTTLRLIDLDDRQETFLSLRSVLTSRVEDFPVFAELFERFWNGLFGNEPPRKIVEREPDSGVSREVQPKAREFERKGLAFYLENWAPPGSVSEQVHAPAMSNIVSSAEKDFSGFGADELQEIARLSRRIAKRLASRPSRRWKPVRRGSRVNLRGSLRASLRTGGELVDLSFKERKPKKTRLVVICDVSGSMDLYSRLLLQFIYALQNSLARVETFVFSTSLERITGHLKNRAYEKALESLTSTRGWSGGTLIGPSLAAFNSTWSRLVDRRTIVIVLSDGWDTGDPKTLSSALATITRRAGRLIWLNPLLGSPTYQALARGMQAALPHVDVFAPLHNLQSLRALERHLVL
ncbi:MAG TPA: VWA domain-containing protein [Blastocatellia bacterium]|nr:VWA domain-containing protein [Blastocatellia bacterium]